MAWSKDFLSLTSPLILVISPSGTYLDDILGEGGQIAVLFGDLRVVFPGRAADDDDAVNACGDQAFQLIGALGTVDLALWVEGRDRRCVDAFELHGLRPTCDALPARAAG